MIPTGLEDLHWPPLHFGMVCDQRCHFCVPKLSFNMYLRVNTNVYIVSKWMFSRENFQPDRDFVYTQPILVFPLLVWLLSQGK